MNCREFEKVVLDLMRNQSGDAAVREQALEHTKSCPGCGARFAEEQALRVGIHAVIADLSATEAPAGMESLLLAAFRQQNATLPTVTPISAGRWRWNGWRIGSIAAGVLLLISVLTMFWQRSHLPHNETTGLPQPVRTFTPQQPASTIEDNHQVALQSESPQPRRRVRRAARDNSGEAEMATKFFPLFGSEDDLSALESVRLVRVELPSSALIDVGLAVNPERTNVPVKADVVLGPDGLARAIRFIR